VFITFNCGTCAAKLEVDALSRGSLVECPQCRTSLTIPPNGVGPGTTVGGFKIQTLLGKGGMGEVFLARQLSMDRDVALKILPQSLTADKEEVERFLNEVRQGARLEHPNIVTAYEAGEDTGVYYLAMAYVRGETLESRLKRTGVMAEADALGIVRKVALALAYAWNRHSLIHRDIKPANIVLNEDEEPKLMDMGLAKSLREAGGMTMAGTVMGTPNYMSPEQADGGDNVDFRADMYSLGATLYHMVTARLPFAGKTLMETLRKQAVESLPDPRDGNTSLSDGCVLIMQTLLARKPEDRYATWEALIKDLEGVLAGGRLEREGLPAALSVMELAYQVEVVEEPKRKIRVRAGGMQPRDVAPAAPPSAPAGPASGKGRPVIMVAAAAVLILGVGIGAWLSLRGGRPAQVPIPVTPVAVPTPVVPADVAKPVPPPASPVTNDPWRMRVEAKPPGNPSSRPTPSVVTPRAEPPPAATPPPAASPAPDLPPGPEVNTGDQLKIAVDGLLRGDPAAARAALDRINATSLSVEDEAIRASLSQVVRMRNTVLESLKADSGKDVEVVLNSGVERLRILSVEGETVRARRQFKGEGDVDAWVDRPFAYRDLAAAECVRRLGNVEEGDRKVMCAMLALEAGKSEQAGKLFSQADTPLGRLIATRWAGVAKPAAVERVPPENVVEMPAERAFRSILAAADMPSGLSEGDLLLEIRKKRFGETQVKRIRFELGLFQSRFASTECAKLNRRVLDTLGSIRVNGPLHVDEAVLAEALEKLERANPVGNVKPTVAWLEDGLSLDFSGRKNLLVISALAGLPITRLDLTGTQVRNLAPLRGMPLRVFRGGEGEGLPDSDLSKMASLSLVDFTYVGTEIKTLHWMYGMPLTNIDIRCWVFQPPDLRHFKGMRLNGLRILAGDNALADISALKGMPLGSLTLHAGVRFPLSDLTPLAGMKLTSLSLVNSKVMDLTPLKGLPLTALDLSGTSVWDIKPLTGLPLKRLSLARTPVGDLSHLAGIPLEYLNVSETRVTDFGVLKNVPTLKDVSR
jgi:hypothetical protein